jgi:dynein assembly factor 5
VIERLLTVYAEGFTEDYGAYDRLHTLYPELIRRLDDNSDAIRLAVLNTWMAYAKCLGSRPYDRGPVTPPSLSPPWTCCGS